MVQTASNMLSLGTTAPNFYLYDTVSSSWIELNKLNIEQGLVIMFICNHCPYVIHLNEKIVEIANSYQAKGIKFIAISSNDVKKYPQDGPELMQKHAQQLQYCFPYLYDKSQDVAKSYQAACTPDFYLFDEKLSLQYRGQFDNSRPSNKIDVTGQDLCTAMDSLLAGETIEQLQKPSLGCNIKWIEG